ncbi:MAG: Hpt domain-containing protein, partial [Acidimicrobiales bacterium]
MTSLSSGEADLYGAELEEHVDGLDTALLALNGVYDPAAVAAAFRHVHSVKGGAASMGFTEVQRLAHRLEDAFCVLRDSKAPASAELLAVAFEANDRFRGHLERLSSSGWSIDEDIRDIQDLIIRIGAVADRSDLDGPHGDVAAIATVPVASLEREAPEPAQIGPTQILSVFFDGSRPLIDLKATAILQRLAALAPIGDSYPSVHELDTSGFVMKVPVFRAVSASDLDSVLSMDGVLGWDSTPGTGRNGGSVLDTAEVDQNPVADPSEFDRYQPHVPAHSAANDRRSSGDAGVTSLRVSVSSLDLLADLAGELVTVRSRLAETVTSVSTALDLLAGSNANDVLYQRLNSMESMIPNIADRDQRLMLSGMVAEMRVANDELTDSVRQMESNSQLKSALVRVSEDVNRVVGRLQEATIDLRLVPLE